MPNPDLCVGAVSRRVVQEAARLRVPQIIASRRQCDVDGGYLGWNQRELVQEVALRSDGATKVVRDHGGPGRGGHPHDDGIPSLTADVEAGFDALHLDVGLLPRDEQDTALRSLVGQFGDTPLEIGDERANPTWNLHLVKVASALLPPKRVTHGVLQTGTKIWADRQVGQAVPWSQANFLTCVLREEGFVKVKLHNADWWGARHEYDNLLDAVNIAPEFSRVETDAWLAVMKPGDAGELLTHAYASRAWRRWFKSNEGTYFDRARCAVRYILETPHVRHILERYEGTAETIVRGRIRDAICRW